MGPAAMEASPPILKLSCSNRAAPFSFMKSSTRSTASTPIWAPQLPPLIVEKAGALQVLPLRQVTTPRPWRPPITNPPLTMDGTTMMHFAPERIFPGMALSPAPISSFSIVAESSMRATTSERFLSLSSGVAAELWLLGLWLHPATNIKQRNNNPKIFFMTHSYTVMQSFQHVLAGWNALLRLRFAGN